MAHAIVASHGGETDAPLAALAAAGAPLRRALARIAGRMVATGAWEALGYVRAADYARERAGISGRELLDLAAVDARLAELPRCEAAFLAGELPWTKLRLLCRAATREDEAHWLAAAAGGAFDPAELPPLVPPGLQIGACPTPAEERDHLRVWAPADVARLFRATLATVQRRIYANLHAHHIVLRSAGGSDAEENLTTLCAAHHQRGVHGGGPLRITGRAPGGLDFDLPLESYAAGDLRLHGPAAGARGT